LIRVRRDDSNVLRNPNSPLAPNPLQKDEPASGLDFSGDFKAAPDIRQTGRQQVAAMYCGRGQRSRYREPSVENVLEHAGIGSVRIMGFAGRSGRATLLFI
jgi:hypothetical protein